MELEDRLLDMKKKIQKTESEIQRNEGRLSGLYDELRNLLGVSKEVSTKALIAKANKEKEKLENDIKEQEKEIEKLMVKIEVETEDWEDEDD